MTPEEEVLRAEQAWLQAHRDVDTITLERLMHPDYQLILPDGSVWDKQQALVSYRHDERSWEMAESDQSTEIINSGSE